jgi:hypothetical protein
MMMTTSTHAAQLALDDATRVVEHLAPVDRHLIQCGERRIESSLSGLTAEREMHEILYRVVPVTALTSTGAGADSAGSEEQHSDTPNPTDAEDEVRLLATFPVSAEAYGGEADDLVTAVEIPGYGWFTPEELAAAE